MLVTSMPHENITSAPNVEVSHPNLERLGVSGGATTIKISNRTQTRFKIVVLKTDQAVFHAIKKLELPLKINNSRQIVLVADSIIEKYNASMDNLIISNLMKTEKDDDFAKSRIAEKIGLLKKFARSNFSNPERYTGENKKTFEEFRLLPEEKRQQVIDGLTSKLLSLD